MTLPNFGIPDQAASEEQLRGAMDANSQALASIIAPIVDYLTSGVASNQKALNRITSALKRQLTRGIQQNAQALGVISNALQQQIIGGINSAGAMLAPIVAATSGIGAGSGLQPAQGFSSPLPPPPPPPALLPTKAAWWGFVYMYAGSCTITQAMGITPQAAWNSLPWSNPPPPYSSALATVGPFVTASEAEQAAQLWIQNNPDKCAGLPPPPPPPPTDPTHCKYGLIQCPAPPANFGIGYVIPKPWPPGYGIYLCVSSWANGDPGNGCIIGAGIGADLAKQCAQALPGTTTTMSGPYESIADAYNACPPNVCGNPCVVTPAPPTCPDPTNPLCPPPPPPPTTPPTPPPGTSCDAPLYISVCPKPSTTPPDSGCTTDPITQEKTCPPPPPPNPINPITPTGGLLQCGLTAEGALPPVGSPEWCGCIDKLIEFFTAIGNESMAMFSLTSHGEFNIVSGSILGAIFGPLSNLPFIGSVTSAVRDAVEGVLQGLIHSISVIGDAQMVGGSATIIGLSVCRTVLQALDKVRVGCDAGLWATVDIKVSISQFERIIDYIADYALPTEIPHITEALEAYKYNTAPEGLVRCWLMLRGANPSVWLPIINARREKLQARESIELDRRHGQDEAVQVNSLRNLGFTDERDAIARVELFDEIPSIADHLHWLQRNVFDDQYVEDFGLLEGFEDRFWTKFGADLRTKGMLKKYAALHYAAHWINPAPGQLLDMVYRLRPDKPGVANPFSLADYERILVEQDVSPYFRKRFAEIAYRVPALGYVRDMYRNRIIDDAELRSIHQDLGYSPSDSERFLQIDRLVRSRMRASEGHGWTPGALANAYSIRQIDQLRVRSEMNAQGFTDDESAALMERADADFQRTILSRARSRVLFAALTQIRQAISAGVLDNEGAVQSLLNLGWPEQFAQGWAQMQLQAANVALVKQATGRIRSAFLRGEVDAMYVETSLSQLSVVPDAIRRLVLVWTLEMTPQRKRRSASQIVNDLSLNEISREEALLRLTNLGYEDADKRLYLADAQRKLIHREQQILAAEQKTERMHAAAVEKAQKEAERQAKEELHYLKMLSPVSKMQRWAALGLMGRDKFFERMRTFGYDDPDTERYYEEACAKRNAQCVEVAPEPPGPPSGNGSSGFP